MPGAKPGNKLLPGEHGVGAPKERASNRCLEGTVAQVGFVGWVVFLGSRGRGPGVYNIVVGTGSVRAGQSEREEWGKGSRR